MGFSVQQPISEVRIAELLSCAFEGGSNYWYQITRYEKPDNPRPVLFSDMSVLGGKDAQIFPHTDYPLTGGAVIVADCVDAEVNKNPREYVLNADAIQKGLDVMAEKYPHHFGDFMKENMDANTGDCFLQCCLFGEEIYG